MDKKNLSQIGNLYPGCPRNHIAEVEQRLDRYLMLVMRIFERLKLKTDP